MPMSMLPAMPMGQRTTSTCVGAFSPRTKPPSARIVRRALRQSPSTPSGWVRRAAPDEASTSSAAAPAASTAPAEEEEVVFLEGNGSAAELVLSLALGITLVYLPLSLASLGRRLWVKYRFTNKRLVVITDSPALKREVAVAYTKIKEIRSVPRAFGLWGDCVFFLKDGSRLELLGVDNLPEIRNYVEQFITDDAY